MEDSDNPSENVGCAIVTGGANGIGKAITLRLLSEGWPVIIADIDEEAGQECIDHFEALGKVQYIPTDVGDEESVVGCIESAITLYGSIGGLVNNAGVMGGVRTPLKDLTLDAWDAIMRANLTGAFLFSKHCAPYLRKTCGSIVNIASTRASQSERDTLAYSASKGGLLALTHSLAVSLGPHVRVNAISPGWIVTEKWKKRKDRREPKLSTKDHMQHPIGRVGQPEDIAALTTWLMCQESEFITGQNLVADGGMSIKMIYEE